MNWELQITERAASDVDEAMAWWASERSVAQAIRWYVGIRRAIREVAEDPRRYPFSAVDKAATTNLQEMHFGLGARPTHRVIFQVEENVVRVLAVRHAAQDEVPPSDLNN